MPDQKKDLKDRPRGKDGRLLPKHTADYLATQEKDDKFLKLGEDGELVKMQTEEQANRVVYFLCTWSTDICLSFTGGTHERGHDGQMYETAPPMLAQFVPVRADLAQCGYFRAEGEEWIERMRKRNADFEGKALLEFEDFEALVAATVKHNERLTLDNARLEQEAFDTESVPR